MRLPSVRKTRGVLGLRRHRETRRRAIALVEAELARLRVVSPEDLRALAGKAPLVVEHEGVDLTTHVDPDGERLLVLVEAQGRRRTFATGGFVMHPDGTTYTPD